MRIGKFKVDIYGFTIEVTMFSDSQAVTKFWYTLHKRFKISTEQTDTLSDAFVFQNQFKCWIVFAETKLSYDTIGHEIDHLKSKLLNSNNIYHGEDNENSALLAGHLSGKIFNILLSKGYKPIDSYNGKKQGQCNSIANRRIRIEDRGISNIPEEK